MSARVSLMVRARSRIKEPRITGEGADRRRNRMVRVRFKVDISSICGVRGT